MQTEFLQIPLNQITIRENYRKTFNETSLKMLCASIKKNGVLQPVLVRPVKKGYEMIAGERRYRASLMAGLATIPAVVREVEQNDVLRQQIVENVQREGVPFMEAAYGFKRLRDEGSYDVAEIARIVGRSESFVYLMLQLTSMSDEAQKIAANGWISQQVAFHIARLPNQEWQTKAANDLARTHKGKLVTENGAKSYIRDTFQSDSGPVLRKNRVRISDSRRADHDDFVSNWKHYLVNFSCDQFEQFKTIVRGRTETAVLAEAVDVVMRNGSSDKALAEAM